MARARSKLISRGGKPILRPDPLNRAERGQLTSGGHERSGRKSRRLPANLSSPSPRFLHARRKKNSRKFRFTLFIITDPSRFINAPPPKIMADEFRSISMILFEEKRTRLLIKRSVERDCYGI